MKASFLLNNTLRTLITGLMSVLSAVVICTSLALVGIL